MMHASILSVLVATVAAFMAGGLWYGPLFGKAWQAEQGFGEAEKARAKAGMARLFAVTLVCEFVSAFFLGHLLAHVSHSARFTMMISVGMALGFVIPAMVVNYMYAMKSLKLIAIDAGHWIVVFAVMGAVFVLMGA